MAGDLPGFGGRLIGRLLRRAEAENLKSFNREDAKGAKKNKGTTEYTEVTEKKFKSLFFRVFRAFRG
jgi:hypothetical protein